MALFGFDTRLQAIVPFTTTPSAVADQLEALRAFGATSLYDATAEGARALVAHGGVRHAIVVVTDGMDTTSRMSAMDVTNVARVIDVPVYIVEVVSPLDHPGAPTAVVPGPAAAPTDKLRELATLTGGEVFIASAPRDRSAAAREVVTELREQYLLGFAPGVEAGWHPLDVRVKHRDLVVRARSGYVAGVRTIVQQSGAVHSLRRLP